ncbi:MFS transporter [Mesobacillus subterraneus]|uniref:nitrate/nitrite transporter n=1 Tax=Mesobacillus subterraneus TaxID=285983 RepID=UPI00203F6A18|nr:nitrate/nitrite transporter [Mesobacillus subterraneus]MCM3662998.1 MFS transporter [Mesobacillus subterraneus]MCM3682826.1 MFS transporter [Mesobacillus subterraneus]
MKTQKLQLPVQTLSLVAGFMVWVILSSLMPFIKEDIQMSANQVAMATAIPVVLGSILRIPIGYWTNKFGARKLFFISFTLLLFPVYFISLADSYSDLLIGGLFVGIGGAIFSVGVTSLPKYFPKERHGFVNGIYGVGNLGTAISTFSAPVIASQFGWQTTVKFYLILLVAFAAINFFLGDKKEPKVVTPLGDQIKSVYKNQKLWALSLFYFLTFGSFVAFTIYLPNFLVSHFDLEKVDAGIRTAGFIALATFFRPIGGWLGDKFNSFIILMFVFAGMTISGILLSFMPSLTLYTIGCLAVAICAGIGNGTVFKLVPLYFSKQAGIVNGIVSAMGGLGGFFPPLMLAFLFNLTGHYAIGFMALSQVALASLIIVIWMYYQDKLSLAKNIIDHTIEGIMITDVKGNIEKVNPAFTTVTGYSPEEVMGKNPNILRSGEHEEDFYKDMWKAIKEKGFWQGEIWNKKKNGTVYPEWLTISPVKNEAGEIKNFVGMFSELTVKNK